MPKRGEKVRNLHTWTEAKYWATVRSALRNAFRYWKPMNECMKHNRKKAGRGFLHQCAACKGWFKATEVQRDHIIPCGKLNCPEDLAAFLARLTEENPAAYQKLCKACHNIKTQKEREQ